jgi:prevent-host-death family protein
MPTPKLNRKRIEVGSTEFRQRIALYVNRAAFDNESVIVSRAGVPTPIAVLISYREYERLTGKSAA